MDPKSIQSNEELTEALRKGEAKAYEKLYCKSLPSIIRFAHLNHGQAEDAQDLLQEAAIVLFRKLLKPDFVLTCAPSTYVYSVCRKKWLYQLKKRKLDIINIIDTEDYIEIPDYVPNEAELLLEQRFREALNQLDEECQVILKKFYYLNLSLEEIAQSINYTSANAVKVKKFRCMQKLKDVFK
ncbi:MAG: sigma-70 family RNA polymerase sigma factor [Bacteroidota bacterium]|nr:sigma-70 family RNA polymerase sigma factor [Bacteroidota bacterium]